MTNARIGWAEALRLGGIACMRSWPAALAMVLAESAGVIFGGAFGLFFWVGSGARGAGALVAGLGATLFFSVLAWVLGGLALGAALRQTDRSLRGLPPEELIDAVAASSASALTYLVVSLWVKAFAFVFAWVSGVATISAYLASLSGEGVGGVVASAAVALALTCAVLLGIGVILWTEAALVRSIGGPQGYLTALFEAGGDVSRRPGAYAGIFAITAGVALGLEVLASGLFGLTFRWDLALWSQVSVGLVTAPVRLGFQLCRLQAFFALWLDSQGRLPKVAPVESIPLAPVLWTAVPVGPVEEGG